jgi:hypothetical protein
MSTLCRYNFLRPGLNILTSGSGKLDLLHSLIATTRGGRLSLDGVEGRDNSRWQVAAAGVVGQM